MFAVIFEVRPKKERWDEYLALAGQLKPKLEAIDGFVENERFTSKREEGRLLKELGRRFDLSKMEPARRITA